MKKEEIEKKTFIFRFDQQNQYADYPQLHSIGWEARTTNAYRYDCERSDIHHLLFQYTLHGEGYLSIHNMVYHIKPGEAFLIEKPGPYRYWLADGSPIWEFIFICFTLESEPYWDKIISKSGHIVHISSKSNVINLWKKIYIATLKNKLNSFYQGSIYAYQFLLELTAYLEEKSGKSGQKTCVQKSLQFIHKHYNSPLTIDELANICDISASYLSYLFHLQIGKTIKNYIRDYRINQACALLRHSKLSIQEIAKKVGYDDPNYFSRVFKQQKHISPCNYRATVLENMNTSPDVLTQIEVD